MNSTAANALMRQAFLGLTLIFLGGKNLYGTPALSSTFPPQEIVSRASYDIGSQSARRYVVDITVPGAPGLYPLKLGRTFTIQNGSFTLHPRWSFDLCYFAVSVGDGGLYRLDCQVWYPNGSCAVFTKNGTTTLTAVGTGDRLKVDNKGNPLELDLADGGRVLLRYLCEGGMSDPLPNYSYVYSGYNVIDPHGLVTTVDLSPDFPYQPQKITDASGRWIQFTYSPALDNNLSRITGAKASTGESVNYSTFDEWNTLHGKRYWVISGATYVDGSSASSIFRPARNQSGVWCYDVPVSFADTRAADALQRITYTYDVAAFVSYARDLDSDHVVSYTNNGKETKGDGTTQTLEWIELGAYSTPLLSKHTDNYGRITKWNYDASGQLTSVVDRLGNITSYVNHAKIAMPIQETHPDGTVSYTEYSVFSNDRYLVTGKTDEEGRITKYNRNPSGTVNNILYPDGSSESWTYNSLNEPIGHTLRNGSTETYTYDALGNLLTHVFPGTNYKESFSYYGAESPWNGRVKTKTDARNNVTTYEYDRAFVAGVQGTVPCAGRGNVTKITYPNNTYILFGYDIYGNRKWEEDELQHRTTYTYDNYRRITSKTDALGQTTTYLYGHDGFPDASPFAYSENKPRRIIYPSGKADGFLYDAEFHLTSSIKGDLTTDASTTTYTYDPVGNQLTSVDPLGRTTTNSYDKRHRRLTQTLPLGQRTTWEYDKVGNVKKTTYADGTSTSQTYDSMNQILESWDAMGYKTSRTYFPSGKLSTYTDPYGYVYSYIYDGSDRKLSCTYPFGSHEDWTYNEFGGVATYRNRSGQIARYTYDTKDREIDKKWDNNAAPEVITSYDEAGRVTWQWNWHAETWYGYNNVNQRISEIQKVHGPTTVDDGRTVVLNYKYDVDGNKSSTATSTGQWNGIAYNGRNQPSKLQVGSDTNRMTWTNYQFNAAAERRFRTNNNGTESDYNYDGSGRLNYLNTYVKSTGTSILLQQFGYDTRDRRTWSLRNQQYGDSYSYQNDGQLTKQRTHILRPDQNPANPAAFTDTFTYDGNGNRGSWNEDGAVTSYGANGLNQYTYVSGVATQHDDRGNLTQLGAWSFTYDAENHMTRVVGPGYDIWPHYDASGRICKAVVNGSYEYRFYEKKQQIERLRQDGSMIDFTIWGPESDEVDARWIAGAWYYYHEDPLNSPVAITDGGANVVERYLYDAFGDVDTRDANWNVRTQSVILNRWRFTGQEYWPEINLLNFKARFYSPLLGRFLVTDPKLFEAGGVNFYQYASNNPININDPDGLEGTSAAGSRGQLGLFDRGTLWLGEKIGHGASNFAFLVCYIAPHASRKEYFGPGTRESDDMRKSPGADVLRYDFYLKGAVNQRNMGYGSGLAFRETLLYPSTADWANTAAQVGGFGGASAINNGDGTVTFTVPNLAGTKSFFYHIVPNIPKNMIYSGPFAPINQTFVWTESIDPNRVNTPPPTNTGLEGPR